MTDIITYQEAWNRLGLLKKSISAVRWYRWGRGQDPIELIGTVQRMKHAAGSDIVFVIIAGPEYEPYHLNLSECDFAPYFDSQSHWDVAFTIERPDDWPQV